MLTLYNTLIRRTEQVEPLEPGVVKVYTCGPTVYRDAHIGNLRSYLMADWMRRIIEARGLKVTHIKNITDVGHMRQEVLERGEDKVIAAAIAEGKSPAQIAEFYTERFLSDEKKLNIEPAHQFPRATDHVEEMLQIVERLVEKSYAYEVEGNVYFDVSAFPDYGKLSGNIQQEQLLEAVRVEADPLKQDPRDFTLWKQAEPGRLLQWPSPWGPGFPGWHIECSAMSMKYLGTRFDIHTGGVDNIFPHHEGEIAQSEGYTSEPVVSLWVHGQHLLADGVKMAKSAGNSFILADIEDQGIDPLAFRYLCMTARYRTRLNFTFASVKAAQRGLLRLTNRVWEWSMLPRLDGMDERLVEEWQSRFTQRVEDDMDMPGALALVWELVRADVPDQVKLHLILSFDGVLGLKLDELDAAYRVPEEIRDEVERRTALRLQSSYAEADRLRSAIESKGYVVQDGPAGTRVRPKTSWEVHQEEWPRISSSAEAASLVGEPDGPELTVGIVASNYVDDAQRCVKSALRWAEGRDIEVLVVDNGSTDGTGQWLGDAATSDERVRVIHTDHVIGAAAAQNIVLKQSRGKTVVLMDTSVEVIGDIYGPIDEALNDAGIGVVGPFGVRSADLQHFHEGEGEAGDVDAMQAYCFAFRRRRLQEVGLMRESFRFYRNLDLDYSFQFKDKGWRIVAVPSLAVQRHVHRVWSEMSEDEREAMSKKNFGRFLDKWGSRNELLMCNQPPR